MFIWGYIKINESDSGAKIFHYFRYQVLLLLWSQQYKVFQDGIFHVVLYIILYTLDILLEKI
jgi:hypothetical protein